jgi:hypothetical protein
MAFVKGKRGPLSAIIMSITQPYINNMDFESVLFNIYGTFDNVKSCIKVLHV